MVVPKIIATFAIENITQLKTGIPAEARAGILLFFALRKTKIKEKNYGLYVTRGL